MRLVQEAFCFRELSPSSDSSLNFLSPILEHFCPLFAQIAQMGLILPRWGLILPRVPPPTPVLTQQSDTPFGDMYEYKTPPTPPQKNPFPGLNLKVGKINYHLGKTDPNWANVWKVGKNFLEVAKKIYSSPIQTPKRPNQVSEEAQRTTYQFGCKLWLQSIQNHARHHFQAIVRSHLKSMCCLFGIRAYALFSDRSSI